MITTSWLFRGFSFGDHLGSGRLLGNRLRFGLRDQVRRFVRSGKPVIGICNGFQVLVKMGLLPGDEEVTLTQTASLALNDSAHYENRWATLEFDHTSPCIWTKGLTRIRVPVRHGEGKFVTHDRELLDRWAQNGQLVAKYVDPSTEYPGATDEVLPIQSHQIKVGEISRAYAILAVLSSASCHIQRHITVLRLSPTGREDKIEHGRAPSITIFRNAVEYSLVSRVEAFYVLRSIPYHLIARYFTRRMFSEASKYAKEKGKQLMMIGTMQR